MRDEVPAESVLVDLPHFTSLDAVRLVDLADLLAVNRDAKALVHPVRDLLEGEEGMTLQLSPIKLHSVSLSFGVFCRKWGGELQFGFN